MLKNLKAYKFASQVKQEAKKVIWPEKRGLINSVGVVVIVVLIFGLVSLVLDYGIHSLVRFLLNIGR